VAACSGSRLPRTRAFGNWPEPVPKPSIHWAVAGVSFQPELPSGSDSSIATAGIAANALYSFDLAASALSREVALAEACLLR